MSITQGITPETLTFDEIKRWSGDEMKHQMRKSDEMRQKVYEIVKSQSLSDIEAAQAQIEQNPNTEFIESQSLEIVPTEPTAEEQAAAQAEALAATATQAEREAAIKTENEQLATAGISVVRDDHGNIVKYVQDYQATDDNGASIGRPTHLEARTWPELAVKQREAHIQAVRWGHRLKQQKITFKETQPQNAQILSDTDLLAAMKDLKSDDPQKQLEAIRKVQKNEQDKQEAQQKEIARQAAVSRRFLDRHKEDFYNCEANVNQVKDYFLANPELVWTDDNLEICFETIESKLAPVPQAQVAFVPPANPVAVTPVVAPAAAVTVTPVVPQAVQPVVATPVQVPAATNTPAATPRPGVNGGVVPGESSAVRPGPSRPRKLTAEEVKSWSPEAMKKNMADKVMRPLIEEFVRERNQRAQR